VKKKLRRSDEERPLMEELEPRLLFSADFAGVFIDGDVVDAQGADAPVVEMSLEEPSGALSDSAVAEQSTRTEMVFVDAATPDYERLVQDLAADRNDGREIEVVVLDVERDGIEQISDALAGRQDLDAVHLVSHGTDAGVQLGSTWLDGDSLDQHSDAVFGWGAAMSEDADLLIYGCDLAGGEAGRALAEQLAELTGADVAASEDPTGSALLGGDWDLEFEAGDVETGLAFSAAAQESWEGVLSAEALWLATEGDVASPSGAPGLDSWNASEALQFGGAGLAFEPGVTAGSLSSVFDLDNFTAGRNVTAMHLVSRNITVGGAHSVDLQDGDLLLAIDGDATLTGTNSLAVESTDVFVFRPDTPGDYSAGTFLMLLDDPLGNKNDLSGVSLVEQDTSVGGTLLQGGSFLLTQSGKEDVQHYSADDVGAGTTSGVKSLLIDGADIGLGGKGGPDIAGVELVEEATTLGGETLQAGQILLTLDGDANKVGDNAIAASRQDVLTLDVSQSGKNTVADAALFLEGADVGLDANEENLNALALEPTYVPVLDLDADDSSGASTGNYATTFSDDGGPVAIADIDAVLSDANSTTLDSLTVTIGNPLDGPAEVLAADTSGTAITASYVGNVLTLSGTDSVANYQQVLRTITYENTSQAPDTTARTIAFVANDGANDSNTAVATVAVIAVNDAPTLGDGTLGTVLQNTANPPGDTIASIFSGQFADADPGASFAGIAAVANAANPATEGVWQYSTNAGTNWFDIGAVGDDATALALDTGTLVRFVPVVGYSGNPTALTVRGLDDTYSGSFSTTAGSEVRANLDTSSPGGSTPIAGVTADVITTIASDSSPAIAGTVAGQTVDDDSTLTPFSGVTITDSDVPVQMLTVTVTLDDAAKGQLSVLGGFVEGPAGTYTFGGSAAAATTAIQGLTFDPTDNRVPEGSTETTQFTITADDGIVVPWSDATTTVIATSVNDAPTGTNLSAPESYSEDTPLDLSDIGVGDVDSPNVTVTLTLSDATAGSLSTGTSGAVTSTFVGGVWTASGAIADVNTLLAGVSFNPAPNYSSDFSIDTRVDDGVGPAITGTKIMTAIPVGDTPQVASITTLEDVTSGLIVVDRNPADGAEVTHFRISGITGGTLTLADGTTPVNEGAFIPVADGQAGLQFTPSPNSTTAGSFDVESSEDGSTVAAQSGMATSTITVTPTPDGVLDEEVTDDDPPPVEEEPPPVEEEPPPVEEEPAIPDPMELGLGFPDLGRGSEPHPDIFESTAGERRSQADPTEARSASATASSFELAARRDGPINASDGEESGDRRSSAATIESAALNDALDQMRREMSEEAQEQENEGVVVVSRAEGVALAFSATMLSAILRAGNLAAIALSSLPLWSRIDALAVLSLSEEERRARDQELQDAEDEEERKAKGIGRLLGSRKRPNPGGSANP
jgi:hypothetical protein